MDKRGEQDMARSGGANGGLHVVAETAAMDGSLGRVGAQHTTGGNWRSRGVGRMVLRGGRRSLRKREAREKRSVAGMGREYGVLTSSSVVAKAAIF